MLCDDLMVSLKVFLNLNLSVINSDTKRQNMNRTIKIIIGVLFLFSGIAKSLDAANFADLISRYGFWWARSISPFISGIEIILGLCMLLDIAPRITSAVVFFLTLLFTLLFANAYIFRHISDCGCMGTWVHVPPFVSFARNILIMAGCVWLWKTEKEELSWKFNRKWIVYIVGGYGLILAGSTLGQPIILQDKIMQSRQVNTGLFYSTLNGKITRTGRSEYFFFSPGCTHCWNATENIKSIKEMPGFENLIGITSDDQNTDEYIAKMHPNFPIVKISGPDLFRMVHSVPVLLILENGKITKRYNGDKIPCGPVLEKMMEGGE